MVSRRAWLFLDRPKIDAYKTFVTGFGGEVEFFGVLATKVFRMNVSAAGAMVRFATFCGTFARVFRKCVAARQPGYCAFSLHSGRDGTSLA
jgi:hypothetical protein